MFCCITIWAFPIGMVVLAKFTIGASVEKSNIIGTLLGLSMLLVGIVTGGFIYYYTVLIVRTPGMLSWHYPIESPSGSTEMIAILTAFIFIAVSLWITVRKPLLGSLRQRRHRFKKLMESYRPEDNLSASKAQTDEGREIPPPSRL